MLATNPFSRPNTETQYDQNQRIIHELKVQKGLMCVQTALEATMANSLNNIQTEMNDLRRQNLEGLAIQQEILRREQLQGQLEEFVYNAQKIVACFSAPNCDEPLASRYFTLKGIIGTVQQNGIGTAIIRGRDNKAAFDHVVSEVQRISTALEQEPEVKEAVAWIKAEEKRIEAKQQKERDRIEAEQKKQQILARLKELQSSKNITFGGWYKRYIHSKLPKGFIGIWIQVLLWGLYGFVWIPPLWISGYLLVRLGVLKANTEATDRQIAILTEQLRQLNEYQSLNNHRLHPGVDTVPPV